MFDGMTPEEIFWTVSFATLIYLTLNGETSRIARPLLGLLIAAAITRCTFSGPEDPASKNYYHEYTWFNNACVEKIESFVRSRIGKKWVDVEWAGRSKEFLKPGYSYAESGPVATATYLFVVADEVFETDCSGSHEHGSRRYIVSVAPQRLGAASPH